MAFAVALLVTINEFEDPPVMAEFTVRLLLYKSTLPAVRFNVPTIKGADMAEEPIANPFVYEELTPKLTVRLASLLVVPGEV